MTSSIAVAIDVGGTKSAIGLVRQDGQVVDWRRRPADTHRGPHAMIDDYVEMVGETLANADIDSSTIVGVGIGCGGPLDPVTGVVYSPPNLPGWNEVPLTDHIARRLGLPVWIENDANAAALAEYTFGAGRGADPLVYITISTGIGAGVMIGGTLFHGATGNAGELGHIVVRTGGRHCRCGNAGCLEAYCSGSSIARRAQEALELHAAGSETSALRHIERPPRGEDVVAHARLGDPLAVALWQETVQLLAAGIVNALHAYDPQRIVLGGGVTRAGDDLLVPLREQVQALSMRRHGRPVEIALAALGDRVGILGAAAVAFAHSHTA